MTLNTPILLDDGALRLRVISVESHAVICQVETGGPLPARSGLNIPGAPFDLPPLGFKDLEDLDAISKLGIDAVYLSYVETANDIRILRDALWDRNCPVPIIAKIERRVALTNLDDITATADAIWSPAVIWVQMFLSLTSPSSNAKPSPTLTPLGSPSY